MQIMQAHNRPLNHWSTWGPQPQLDLLTLVDTGLTLAAPDDPPVCCKVKDHQTFTYTPEGLQLVTSVCFVLAIIVSLSLC